MKEPSSRDTNTFDEALISHLLASRKYRSLNLPPATIADLIVQARKTCSSDAGLEQTVREKLHNLVATYLGDPDYAGVRKLLDDAYAGGSQEQVREVCRQILVCHASTRERLPILEEFYATIFRHTGVPASILDLACGLNPFALPWMRLSADTRYYACDLHQPRLDLIAHFFVLNHMQPLVLHQDVLVNPPDQQVDIAFFFKEAHRFEQRRKGCNREFWQSLQCKILLVSLPVANLTGSHPKLEQHRRLVMDTLQGLPWPVEEIQFSNEIVFCIHKQP